MGTCLRIPVVQLKQAAQLVPRLLYPTLQLGVPKSDPSGGAIIVYIASAEIVDIVIPGASIPYDEADFTIPFVLVVGSEASGVSDELYAELAANSATVKVVHLHIPMVATGMDSFNAAVAGSVVLAEAARQRRCALSSR